MRQDLSASNRIEVGGRLVRELTFVEIPFSGGAVRISSGTRNYTVDGHTFQPGVVGMFTGPNENMDATAQQSQLVLSGADAGLIATLTGGGIHFLRVRVWYGYLDASHVLVDAPLLVFWGFLGKPTITPGGGTDSITLTLETLRAIINRISRVRGCDADQQARFAGDTIFDQVGVNNSQRIAFGNGVHQGLGTRDNDGFGGINTGRGPQSPVQNPSPGQPLFPTVPTSTV